MFINFDRDPRAHCDNCGIVGTVMHLVMLRSENSLNLCAECFGAMALAFSHAARKLKLNAGLFSSEATAASKGA